MEQPLVVAVETVVGDQEGKVGVHLLLGLDDNLHLLALEADELGRLLDDGVNFLGDRLQPPTQITLKNTTLPSPKMHSL